MKILVLNGSPRTDGNTSAMVAAFVEGASENIHNITVIPVFQKNIGGCLACEHCHTIGNGKCIQDDDMQEKNLKKAALILSSGSDNVFGGAIYEYQNSFLDYLKLEDMGIFTAFDKQNKSEEKLSELRAFGQSLR